MYDGYQKYDADVAATYEDDRKKEQIWWAEEAFMDAYFADRQPRRLLDAPVGTGRFLPRYNAIPEVVGLDISEDMLNEAASKLDALGPTSATLTRGNIFRLEFADDHFDLSVCWRFAHLVPAELLTDALRELGRVTAGEILLQTYVGQPQWQRLVRSLVRLPRKLLKQIDKTTNPTTSLPWSHIRAYFHTEKTLAERIAAAGLTIVNRTEVGVYNDSVVYVYELAKLKAVLATA